MLQQQRIGPDHVIGFGQLQLQRHAVRQGQVLRDAAHEGSERQRLAAHFLAAREGIDALDHPACLLGHALDALEHRDDFGQLDAALAHAVEQAAGEAAQRAQRLVEFVRQRGGDFADRDQPARGFELLLLACRQPLDALAAQPATPEKIERHQHRGQADQRDAEEGARRRRWLRLQQFDRQFPLGARQLHGDRVARCARHGGNQSFVVEGQQRVFRQEPGRHDLFQRAVEPDRRDLAADEAVLLEAGYGQPEQESVRRIAGGQRPGVGRAPQAATGVEHHRQHAAGLCLPLGCHHGVRPAPGAGDLLWRQPVLPGDHLVAAPQQSGAPGCCAASAAWRRSALQLCQIPLKPGEVKAQGLFQPLRIGGAAALLLLRLDIAQEQCQQQDRCRHQRDEQPRQPEQGVPA